MGSPESRFPLGGGSAGSGRATATCYCGTVCIEFGTKPSDIAGTFVCHCTDCHKISSSMFCTAFIAPDSSVKHIRGKEALTMYAQNDSIKSGNTMSNHFCSKCGTLMYRRSTGYPGYTLLRTGPVDDFELQDKLLKPGVEQYTSDRGRWLAPVPGVEQAEGRSKRLGAKL